MLFDQCLCSVIFCCYIESGLYSSMQKSAVSTSRMICIDERKDIRNCSCKRRFFIKMHIKVNAVFIGIMFYRAFFAWNDFIIFL